MSMYSLIGNSDNYSKTSRSVWKYYGDEPALTNIGVVANFHNFHEKQFVITFAVTDAKRYVPLGTLSTQEKLKSGFKRTINWRKYQPKISVQAANPYLDFLIDPSFQGVNRRVFFV